MKNLLSLWVMALMLVLLVSGSAMATIDPILDGGMDPRTGLDEGSQDGDHPWGGDQTPEISGTESTIDRPTRVIVTTSILPFDQLILSFVYSTFFKTDEIQQIRQVENPTIVEERSTRYESVARRSSLIDKKKGVSR